MKASSLEARSVTSLLDKRITLRASAVLVAVPEESPYERHKLLALHDRPVTAWEACQPVGGLHARDQRAGHWQQGIKHTDRLTDKKRGDKLVRVRSRVSVTGGYVSAAHPERAQSKNARRKAQRYGR